MPRLAIINYARSSVGGQRFLRGLVEGLQQQPEIDEWDITVLMSRRNSGGYEIDWPERLEAPNFQMIRVDERAHESVFWRRFLNRTADPRPVLGLPGTISAQRLARRLVEKYVPPKVFDDEARARVWIERFCSRGGFDLVYFSWPYFLDCPRVDMPIVCTPHDFNFKHFAWEDSEVQMKVDAQTEAWIERSARLVVSSDFIAGELRDFYPRHAHKARVVRLGIPGSGRRPSSAEVEECRSKWGLPESFVLTAGWLSSHKNPMVVFEAISELKRRGIRAPLVCAGPGSEQLRPGDTGWKDKQMRSLIEKIEHLGLRYGEDYFALGYVSEFDLDCIYRLASLLVVASLYEAGSFPALEAMSVGCPVVMSRIPALVEEYELLGGNAWLFDPKSSDELAETVKGVLSAPAEAAEKARCAARIVPRVFSWDQAGKGYLAVFREALG